MFRSFRPDELPCPVGQSPFRIKGMAYRLTWESCADVPGGAEAVIERLPSGEARAFLTQKFLAAGWYDVLPMIWLDVARADVLGLPPERSLALGTTKHARASLGGIYRSLLRLLSTSTAAAVLPRIVHTYYDFGTVTTSQDGPDGVYGVVRGVPALIAGWYMICSGAFAAEALSLGGAREVSVEWAPPKPAGRRDGFPLTDLSWRLRWRGTR